MKSDSLDGEVSFSWLWECKIDGRVERWNIGWEIEVKSECGCDFKATVERGWI